ncbi:TATA-binding protein-associated phosphoprotein [Entamoeba marina]
MQHQRRPKEICDRYAEKEKEMKNFESYEQAVLLSESQCSSFYQKSLQDKVRPKTALRRNSKNKSTFAINFLFDIAIEHGFMFNSNLSKRSTKCLQVERIQQIFFEGQLLMDYNEIIQRGHFINSHLFSIAKNQTKATISQNDPTLQQCLNNSLSTINQTQIINA